MGEHSSSGTQGLKRHLALDFALLAAATCLVFLNTLDNAYHLDDFGRIANNPEIERVFPLWRHFLDPRTSTSVPTTVQYRPLLPLSLSVNAALADAAGIDRLRAFHAGNILLHLLSGLLLYLIVLELARNWSGPSRLSRRSREVALLTALAFSLHPIAGVPVNYLAARDLLLMQFFFLASFGAYLGMRRRGESALGWAAVLFLLTLSILSKTNSVAAPLVILFFELLCGRESLKGWRLWRRVLPFAAVSASFFLFTRLALDFSDAGMLFVSRPAHEYPLTQAKLHLFYYLRNFFWPFEMRPLPRIEPVQSLANPLAAAGGLMIVGSLFLAWRLREKAPLAAFAIMAYWMMFAPTSSLLPFRMLAADYRQYPSLPFLCLGAVIALFALLRPAVRWPVATAALTYFAMGSVLMNQVWESEKSLWAHSVRHGATSQAHHNYARSLSADNPELAEKHYLEALRLNPANVYSHVGLGMLYLREGRKGEGLGHVRRAVQLTPDWAMPRYWLARALSQVGKKEEAAEQSALASRLDPRNLEYAYQAAFDAQAIGRYEQSLRALGRLHALGGSYRDSRFLEGFAWQKLNRNAKAIEAYRRFLEEHPDHAQGHFNLAYALMESGEWQSAVEHFERTLELDPAYREAHLHLARCHREIGNEAQAARHLAQYER